MKKTFDFWRAMGATAGLTLCSLFVAMFVYAAPSTPLALDTADTIMFFLNAILIAVFSYLYFKDGGIDTSARTGLYLGCVIFLYTFLSGFFSGYMSAAFGVPALPPLAPWIMYGSIAVGLLVPALVGQVLSKKK
jgi:hypothetical protein